MGRDLVDSAMAWAVGHNMKVLRQDAEDAWAAVRAQNATIQKWKEAVAQRDRRIIQLEAALAGIKAERDAFKQAYPTSPLMQLSNVRYKDPSKGGALKPKLTLIWEEAYDKKAEEYGLVGTDLRID